MTQPTKITLIRHGETIWNRELRMQGSKDIPLSEIGLKQAELVAKRLQGETYHRVYSSPLQRAHKTASTIAGALQIPHHVHDQLHERSYGKLEGLTREEILAQYPDFWSAQRQEVPGVESMEEIRRRAGLTLNSIADQHPGEHVLIVSHGGTINAALHAISEGRYDGTGLNRLGNTSITRLIREADGKWIIESVGDATHLQELAQEMENKTN